MIRIFTFQSDLSNLLNFKTNKNLHNGELYLETCKTRLQIQLKVEFNFQLLVFLILTLGQGVLFS
jgi:hypothetical protein